MRRLAFQLQFAWSHVGDDRHLVIAQTAPIAEERCVWEETPDGLRLGVMAKDIPVIRWLTKAEMQTIHVVELDDETEEVPEANAS